MTQPKIITMTKPTNNRYAAKVWYGPKDKTVVYSPNFNTYHEARYWITEQPEKKAEENADQWFLKMDLIIK